MYICNPETLNTVKEKLKKRENGTGQVYCTQISYKTKSFQFFPVFIAYPYQIIIIFIFIHSSVFLSSNLEPYNKIEKRKRAKNLRSQSKREIPVQMFSHVFNFKWKRVYFMIYLLIHILACWKGVFFCWKWDEKDFYLFMLLMGSTFIAHLLTRWGAKRGFVLCEGCLGKKRIVKWRIKQTLYFPIIWWGWGFSPSAHQVTPLVNFLESH